MSRGQALHRRVVLMRRDLLPERLLQRQPRLHPPQHGRLWSGRLVVHRLRPEPGRLLYQWSVCLRHGSGLWPGATLLERTVRVRRHDLPGRLLQQWGLPPVVDGFVWTLGLGVRRLRSPDRRQLYRRLLLVRRTSPLRAGPGVRERAVRVHECVLHERLLLEQRSVRGAFCRSLRHGRQRLRAVRERRHVHQRRLRHLQHQLRRLLRGQ